MRPGATWMSMDGRARTMAMQGAVSGQQLTVRNAWLSRARAEGRSPGLTCRHLPPPTGTRKCPRVTTHFHGS